MESINYKEVDKKDLFLSIAICFILISYMFQNMLGAVFNRIGFLGKIISADSFVSLIWYALVLITLPTVIKRCTFKIIIIPLFLFVQLLFSFFRYGHINGFEQYCVILIFQCIPAYFIMSSIKDYSVFNFTMRISSYILFVFSVLYFFFFSMKIEYRDIGYDMVFGYQVAFVCLLIAENYLHKKNKINLIMLITCIAILFIRGSRGPIYVLVIYLIIRTLFNKNRGFSKVISLLGLFVLSYIIIANYIDILTWANTELKHMGIYSRNLDYIINGNFMKSNEREAIYDVLINDLQSNIIFGKGLFADRVLLYGGYAHNIIIEFIYNFGVVLGTIFPAAIIFGALRKLLNKETNNYFFVFISYGIGSLMFSGSYLTSYYFFIMLAMLVSKYSNVCCEKIGCK